MKRKITLSVLSILFCLSFLGANPYSHRDWKLGELLSAAPLNGTAASLTFTVGPALGNDQLLGYSHLILYAYYNYTTTTVAITTTCKVGPTVATALYQPTTCLVSGGTCMLNLGGVMTTSSLSSDTYYVMRFGIEGSQAISCTVSSSGSPGATDTITITGYLIAD